MTTDAIFNCDKCGMRNVEYTHICKPSPTPTEGEKVTKEMVILEIPIKQTIPSIAEIEAILKSDDGHRVRIRDDGKVVVQYTVDDLPEKYRHILLMWDVEKYEWEDMKKLNKKLVSANDALLKRVEEIQKEKDFLEKHTIAVENDLMKSEAKYKALCEAAKEYLKSVNELDGGMDRERDMNVAEEKLERLIN